MDADFNDLHKSAEKLIGEVQELIGGSATRLLTRLRALYKFACVLVVVSLEPYKLSKRIVWLTWALLLPTAVLLIVTWIHS